MAPGSAVAGTGPFSPRQLWRIDEALAAADHASGLTFSLYVGDLAQPVRDNAELLHDQLDPSDRAVLIAVSPNQRVVEIVTGQLARMAIPDRACGLATLSMTASFEGGDLATGVVTGLRMLADHAAQG